MRPERVTAYIVGVAGVALGPLLLLLRLSVTPILISILLGLLEKLSLSLELLVVLLLATWQLLPGLDGTGVARSLSVCSWARERPGRRAREETGPSRRDGLCPLGCQGRLSLADSTARALIERRTRSGP